MPEQQQAEFPEALTFGDDQYHPSYTQWLPLWEYYQAIFDGSDGAKEYLTKFIEEETAAYKIRQQDSAFPRICARALGVFTGHIFSQPPDTSQLPEKLKYLNDNFDGDGTDAVTFLQDQHRTPVMPLGACYLLVTKPIATTPIANREQEIEQGLQPMVVPFSPVQLVKWDFDEQGNLLYVVLKDKYRRSGGFAEAHVEYNLLRIWTQTSWALYHSKDDGIEGANSNTYELLSSGKHKLGEVPLVAIYNMRQSRFCGTTEMRTLGLADFALDIYSKITWLDQGLKYQGFPIPVIKSQDEDLTMVKAGPGYGIQLKGENDDAKMLETTGQALSLLNDKITASKMEFLDTAFRQLSPTKATGGNEAAEKKKLDLSQLVAAVKAKGNNVQEAHRNVYRLAAKWEGIPSEGFADWVEYSIEVTPEAFVATIDEIGKLYSTYGIIDHETAFEMVKNNGELPESIEYSDVEARMAVEQEEEAKRFAEAQAAMTADQQPPQGGNDGAE